MERYTHSGRAPLTGVIRGLGIGLAAALVLAFAYAYAIVYIPVAGTITFVLSAGFGFLMMLATSAALKAGKVRNTALSTMIGVAVAIVAFYLSWCVWLYALFSRQDMDVSLLGLLTQPGATWELVTQVNEVGAWTLKSFTPTGGVLWALWGVEALLIVGPSLFTGVMNDDPFCETCETWCEAQEGVVERGLEGADASLLSDPTAWRGMSVLERLGPRSGDDAPWLRVDVLACEEQCQKTRALAAHKVSVETDSDGDSKEVVETMVTGLLLGDSEHQRLQQLSATVAESVPPPAV